ncbi:Gfo/Idh/MocA family oxidoreductase [Paenibacillus woosongensis]|uniref:Gfo/Idh/MocA family oxidoreductase n=1 Tax=Paenibacillus woosongensis TaxID=307580 RepID=A0AA95KVJ1_9BACL|nr:Gfo/Idh/MocA family oxidoreductase [Paenibacillus woosongensis]WHX51248.1 Gfo/Idh/MocA family oxidoreductase [Paenibacillus woosongensis]
MRIGIIGLGDIARKAYLPVITAIENIELVLCTRNSEVLRQTANQYRIGETANRPEQFIAAGIDAAFIHTATESHAGIIELLIRHGIHVYVDKPISYNYGESARLVELAESMGVQLMVGFNRRYAPMVAAMKEQNERRLVIMQKNRVNSPDFARRFVLDDFIHVVDTVRFLAPGEIKDTKITTYQQNGKLHHVTLQLEGDGFTSTAIMNRENGITEETLEVMSPGNKWLIDGLNTTRHFHAGKEQLIKFNDWDPVLYRRGFHQIISQFLDMVRSNSKLELSARDALETHRLCELVVKHAEEHGADIWHG